MILYALGAVVFPVLGIWYVQKAENRYFVLKSFVGWEYGRKQWLDRRIRTRLFWRAVWWWVPSSIYRFSSRRWLAKSQALAAQQDNEDRRP